MAMHRVLSLVFLSLTLVSCASTPKEAHYPRLMAEWEPAVGTLVVYPFALPDALVVDLAGEGELYVLVRDEERENAEAKLRDLRIGEERITYVPCEVRMPWTRDWGPHQIESELGERVLVDHVFRGYPWVPADCEPQDIQYWSESVGPEDGATDSIAYALDLFVADLPVIATGGNLLTDGHGRAFCTYAQLVENSSLADEEAYREQLREHLGITDLVVLENTEPMGIQHIDCWLKVIDEETLLIKKAPEDHPEHDPIERNIQLLRELETPSGGRYEILRIDCPPYRRDRLPAYTNSLRLNDVVHVPLFGGAADEKALATYRAAFPDCEVRGYLHDGWQHFDALHCRTRALHSDPASR